MGRWCTKGMSTWKSALSPILHQYLRRLLNWTLTTPNAGNAKLALGVVGERWREFGQTILCLVGTDCWQGEKTTMVQMITPPLPQDSLLPEDTDHFLWSALHTVQEMLCSKHCSAGTKISKCVHDGSLQNAWLSRFCCHNTTGVGMAVRLGLA